MLFGAFAAVVVASGAPTAAPASAPPAAVAPLKPLREVVYRVSYSRRRDVMLERFAGLHIGLRPREASDSMSPDQTSTIAQDEGTITVDVILVANDGIRVRVTERWNARTQPSTFVGNVMANGAVGFGDQELSLVSRSLLPFFGRHFAAGGALTAGSTWDVRYTDPAVDADTRYTVKDDDGTAVALDELETVKVKLPRGTDSMTTGTVRYKPSMLVPLSGTLRRRALSSVPNVDLEITFTMNFERVSDTFDPPQKP